MCSSLRSRTVRNSRASFRDDQPSRDAETDPRVLPNHVLIRIIHAQVINDGVTIARAIRSAGGLAEALVLDKVEPVACRCPFGNGNLSVCASSESIAE